MTFPQTDARSLPSRLHERARDAATASPAFEPAVRVGDLIYTSGQLPIVDGELVGTGLLGADVTVAEAAVLARICTANALAAIAQLVDLADIERVVKLNGFIASASGFFDQAAVMNGASAFLREVLGDAGAHARTAIGVAALPRKAPVEVELIVQCRPGAL